MLVGLGRRMVVRVLAFIERWACIPYRIRLAHTDHPPCTTRLTGAPLAARRGAIRRLVGRLGQHVTVRL
jgi:hypothetical protein